MKNVKKGVNECGDDVESVTFDEQEEMQPQSIDEDGNNNDTFGQQDMAQHGYASFFNKCKYLCGFVHLLCGFCLCVYLLYRAG